MEGREQGRVFSSVVSGELGVLSELLSGSMVGGTSSQSGITALAALGVLDTY